MSGKMKINNNNGKLVVIENPDTNNTNITIDGSQIVVKNDVYTKTQSDSLLGNKVTKISSPTANALVKVNADGSISNSNITNTNDITELAINTGQTKVVKNIPISGADYKHKYLILTPVPNFGAMSTITDVSGKFSIKRNNVPTGIDTDISFTIGYGNSIYFDQISKGIYTPELVQVTVSGISYLALYWYSAPNSNYATFDGVITKNNTTIDSRFLTMYETDNVVHSAVSYNKLNTTIPEGVRFRNISTDPTVLDAYQEGTWSPTVYGSATGGTCTYTTRIGEYTRIGNRCFYSIYVGWSGHTGTGALAIDLPFINKSGTFSAGTIAYLSYSFTSGDIISCFAESLNHLMFVASKPNGVLGQLIIQSSGAVMVNGSYIIQE